MSGLFGCNVSRVNRKSVEWYTPAWIFDALGITFDLDPASPFDAETHVPASVKLTIFDNGLTSDWNGRVWLNPPYGPDTGAWMNRMIGHGHGIALVFSRTDAKWCQDAMKSADAFLFLRGRVDFCPGNENKHKASRSGAGTVVFAWGSDCVSALERLRDQGVMLYRTNQTKGAAA